MTNTLMKWHLARDDQVQLAKFCDKHQIDRYTVVPKRGKGEPWYMITKFDHGGYIIAELLQEQPINDSYQVVSYAWGSK
jgi:hypothetical protein